VGPVGDFLETDPKNLPKKGLGEKGKNGSKGSKKDPHLSSATALRCSGNLAASVPSPWAPRWAH